MRLLLLLSALLAALTGAGAGARAVGTAPTAASARVAAPEPVCAHAHVLAATRTPGAAVVEPAPVVRSAPRPTAALIWMGRRRE